MKRGRYCLIGAGAAGLGALQVLLDEGFSVDCFERSDRVGGHWHSDYESLHLITPRDSSGFEGSRCRRTIRCSRAATRCATTSSASPRIMASARTSASTPRSTAARPLDATGLAGWEVTTSDGERRTYDGVIVANGHLWDPFVPEYPGRFAGHVVCTAARYRNAGDLHGDRVLVVGAGNSGCDLAVDAAQAGRETYVSVRNGLVFQPKTLFGRPRSELPLLARLPIRVQERVTRALIDVALGPSERYGLPAPATRNLHRNRPVVNGQLLHFIHHGRVRVAPGIERFDGHDVHFTDGTVRAFDTIVYATGFKATLPFLDSTPIAARRRRPAAGGGDDAPRGPGAAVLRRAGRAARAPAPVYSAQARLIAKFLTAQERAPIALSARFARASPPESRIDIPRHEWQRDMTRTHRRIDRILRRTRAGAHAAPRPATRDPLAVHG